MAKSCYGCGETIDGGKYCPACNKLRAARQKAAKVRHEPKQAEKPNPPGICHICGQFCLAVGTHLRYSHDGMTLEEYYRQYPKARKKSANLWAGQPLQDSGEGGP